MRTDLASMLASQAFSFNNHRLHGYTEPAAGRARIDRRASVNLACVRGLWHPEYAGLTWGELVGDPARGVQGRLKRVEECLRELHRSPAYYFDQTEKYDWSFRRVDDDYFIGSGHHRSIVGRYFLEANGCPPVVHGVVVMTYKRADWERAQTTHDVEDEFLGDGGRAVFSVSEVSQ